MSKGSQVSAPNAADFKMLQAPPYQPTLPISYDGSTGQWKQAADMAGNNPTPIAPNMGGNNYNAIGAAAGPGRYQDAMLALGKLTGNPGPAAPQSSMPPGAPQAGGVPPSQIASLLGPAGNAGTSPLPGPLGV